MPLPPGMKCTKKSVDVFAEMPLQKLEPNNLNKNYFIIFFKINAFFTVRKQNSRTCTAALDTGGKQNINKKKKYLYMLGFFFSLISY